MDWEELQKKHFQEWKEFEKASTEAWNKMHEIHNEIQNVFKNDPARIPPETTALIKSEKEQWKKEWGRNGEKRMRLIYRQQKDSERLIKQQERERRVFEINDGRQQSKDRGR